MSDKEEKISVITEDGDLGGMVEELSEKIRRPTRNLKKKKRNKRVCSNLSLYLLYEGN